MASSQYVRKRNEVKQALRAVRRVYRRTDSLGETLERRLDRMIERKTLIYKEEFLPLSKDYYSFKAALASLEKALADAISISSSF